MGSTPSRLTKFSLPNFVTRPQKLNLLIGRLSPNTYMAIRRTIMLTFLNLLLVAAWASMSYMLITSTDFFTNAIVFYYIVMAVIGLFTVCLTIGCSNVLNSLNTKPSVLVDAKVFLDAVSSAPMAQAILPKCASIALLILINQPILAGSQFVLALACLVCTHIASKHN